MKVTVYELLGMVKDEPDRSIYVKYFDKVNKKEDVMWACKENIIYKLEQLVIELNDTVEIIEKKKIPEKLDKYADVSGNLACDWTFGEKKLKDKINEIIDYLKNKGDE